MNCFIRPVIKKTQDGGQQSWLRVLTYNVLAQTLLRRSLYPTNGKSIRWNVRYPVIVEEIQTIKPNLVFMQEVDKDKLDEYTTLFESQGMVCEFAGSSNKRHGILIGWKTDIFELEKESVVTINYDSEESAPSPQTDTDNVGLLLALRRKNTDEIFIVGTTHLYWHPDADYERFRQTVLLIKNTTNLRKKYKTSRMIIGGDLNSTSDSPAYLYLANNFEITNALIEDLLKSAKTLRFGPIDSSPDKQRLSKLNDPQQTVDELVELAKTVQLDSSELGLKSCYKYVLDSEPEFTNWTDSFRETLDYIFVTSAISINGVMKLPKRSEMGNEPSSLPRSRPEGFYPSDHLPLMAELN